MGWDKRIGNDELMEGPRQPCHIEGLYLFSEPSSTKIWAVDAKDGPFLIIAYVVKPLGYGPPWCHLSAHRDDYPLQSHCTLETLRGLLKSP